MIIFYYLLFSKILSEIYATNHFTDTFSQKIKKNEEKRMPLKYCQKLY